MICKNPKCMAQIKSHYWGDGYCSRRCMHGADRQESEAYSGPPDPNSPDDLRRDLLQQADFLDAMEEAFQVDARLPKIIYLRRRGMTWREIGKLFDCDFSICNKIYHRATRKLLKSCGL